MTRHPDPLTQREVATILRISRGRVGQIERRALEKIRAAFGETRDHGPAALFLADAVGVPEPEGDVMNRRGENGRAAAARRVKGRWA